MVLLRSLTSHLTESPLPKKQMLHHGLASQPHFAPDRIALAAWIASISCKRAFCLISKFFSTKSHSPCRSASYAAKDSSSPTAASWSPLDSANSVSAVADALFLATTASLSCLMRAVESLTYDS